jgi:hypothetical protein
MATPLRPTDFITGRVDWGGERTIDLAASRPVTAPVLNWLTNSERPSASSKG